MRDMVEGEERETARDKAFKKGFPCIRDAGSQISCCWVREIQQAMVCERASLIKRNMS